VPAKSALLARNMQKKVAGDLISTHSDCISSLPGYLRSTRTNPMGNAKYRLSDINAKIEVNPSEAVNNDRLRTCRKMLIRKSR
jgi:hypothetical protein